MGDPNLFRYEDGAGGPAGPARIPPTQHRFTEDELRVLQECNTESFFQRSLPLGTTLGFGTYYCIRNGYLKPNSRFGAGPKVALAVIVGYLVGKLSYQNACAEKLMRLPDSYIGQLLREKKEGRTGMGPRRTPAMFGATSEDIYSDAGPGSSLDLDTDRPLFSDDSYRPGSDTGSIPQSPENLTPRPTMSYDELRRKNRNEYTDSRQDPYKYDPYRYVYQYSIMDPTTVPSVSRARPPPSAPTNKYGDSME